MFNETNLTRELLTTRQTTKLRHFKISKAQIFKLIQSGRFLGSLLSTNVGPLMKVAVP